MTTATTFTFDKDYDNTEQVREYLADFLAVYPEVKGDFAVAYNDRFRGRIGGIAGPDEDTAIYLLQKLKSLDELDVRVAEFLAEGGEEITDLDRVRRGTVVHFGFYVGGTGWQQWDSARLVPRDGKPYAVLPKGKRTHGYYLTHRVLFKEQT
jgi:hypothetical protein